MIDKKRVLRTLIQSACGAGVALVTAVAGDFSRQSAITAAIQFCSTVLIAVMMNIKKQTEEDGKNE